MNVRYPKSVQPVSTDGRDIDPQLGSLVGEAAHQRSSGSTDQHLQIAKQSPASPDEPTYYDRPLLKASVWEWAVPTYYYVGGLTGASLVLGAAAQLADAKKFQRLIRRCHWIGFIGVNVSGALLIQDLGRPARFLNMMRVFRPTSPMNMGVWIISGVGLTCAPPVLLEIFKTGGDGLLGTLNKGFGIASGVFGVALATYTGVLVANTAVPVWQQSRRVLPILFGASAMSAAGSFFQMFTQNEEERRVTKAFKAIGQSAEIAASIVMEKHASQVPRVGLPLKQGFSGAMWKAATVLTAASLILGFLNRKSRGPRRASGILGSLGSLLMRFAVEQGGVSSSRDARATFQQQRAGQGAADLT